MVKKKTKNNLPAVQETRVQSLEQEDPLEEGRPTYSGIFAWRILWTEQPGGLVYGVAKNQARLSTHTYESKYSRLSRLSFLHWKSECGRNHILLHFTLEYLMFLQLMKANLRSDLLPAC